MSEKFKVGDKVINKFHRAMGPATVIAVPDENNARSIAIDHPEAIFLERKGVWFWAREGALELVTPALDPSRPFAVGDRVVCVEGSAGEIDQGAAEFVKELHGTNMLLVSQNGGGIDGPFWTRRFRHLDHPEAVALLAKMGVAVAPTSSVSNVANFTVGQSGRIPGKPAPVCTCHPLAWLMDDARGCPGKFGKPCLPKPTSERTVEPEKPTLDYRTTGDYRAERDRATAASAKRTGLLLTAERVGKQEPVLAAQLRKLAKVKP